MTLNSGTRAGQDDRALLEAVAALMVRVPEGFVDLRSLAGRLGVRAERLKLLLNTPAATDQLGLRGAVVFDATRISAKLMQARLADLQPVLPIDEALSLPPITTQMAQRQLAVAEQPALRALLSRVALCLLYTSDAADE